MEDAQDWRLVKSWVEPNKRATYANQHSFEVSKQQEEWKLSPLYIPDREAKEWKTTHPLEQIRKTQQKNAATNTHFINVVKVIKWWKRFNYPEAGQPKSYPLEHLIWHACPDDIKSVAQGVTFTFETIVSKYPPKPYLPDHGVVEHNVMGRVEWKEYEEFYQQIIKAASLARIALDSTDFTTCHSAWTSLFGDQFPPAPEHTPGGFTPRGQTITQPSGGRFA
ncbi:hypothetical protein [Cohnella yongneupensis]|uniref:Uncharacterized protein n=1 Tax=Cohnella yongneupensis TaxID=425006 RepID=A0ABW0QSB9_9BACL